MDKRISRLCIFFGVLLMLAGIYLHLFYRAQNREAEKHSAAILSRIKTEISSEPSSQETVSFSSSFEESSDYLGYLSIPALELELPVLAQWDYDNLKLAPCRFTGSVWEDDLVVMAHNYDHHFGKLSSLSFGDAVYFTDSQGLSLHYQVAATDVLSPTAVTEVTDNAYDLTLFTCTYGGKHRIVVYCEKVWETEKCA